MSNMYLRFFSVVIFLLTVGVSGAAQDVMNISFELLDGPFNRNDFLHIQVHNPTDQAVGVTLLLEVKSPADSLLFSWQTPELLMPTGRHEINIEELPEVTFSPDQLNLSRFHEHFSVSNTVILSELHGNLKVKNFHIQSTELFDFTVPFSSSNIPALDQGESKDDTRAAPYYGHATAYAIPQRMNVFYTGVDNPLYVVGADSSTTISCDQPGIGIRANGNGHFTVNVRIPGEYTLIIQTSAGTSRQTFRGKRIPDPVPSLSEKTSGNIGAAQFKEERGVIAFLHRFDFEAHCQTTGFILWRIQTDGTRQSVNNKGPRFSAETTTLVKQAEAGDIYIFDNIRARCSGDVAGRKISSMSFFVR